MTDTRGAHVGPGASDTARRERFARAKAIFCESVELPEAERARVVAALCSGDEALRHEVESLLRSDGQDGSFLERPAAALLSAGELAPIAAPQLTPGDRLGGYVVEALLGAGGMGEVYLARDTRLRRRVAIKIVGSGQAGARADAALFREARHASVLSHPCICAVHEVGESEGRRFIVMEYVEGETLRAMVARRGPLPPADVLRQGVRIADALDHAHARGVVHRDLKSANVMVSGEGDTKVLDFGLARWLPDAVPRQGSTSFDTETLALAGTLDYMAPEVLLGGAADERSDIWSLGVLLHEMAEGTPPFRRGTPVDTASAILKADPPPFRTGIALGLRLVIRRCLSREPARRYQRAADVRQALEALSRRGQTGRRLVAGLAWAEWRPRAVTTAAVALTAAVLLGTGAWLTSRPTSPAAAPMRTLLVMPLVSPPGEAGGEPPYFAEGLTEALIAEIGGTGIDRVISRTSAMAVVRGRKTPRVVAGELQVDGILDGTVNRTGDRVRLSVRLLKAATGREVWSTSQERPASEAAALVASIAAAVAGGMNHPMSDEAARRLSSVRAVRPDVQEAYLKGRYEWNARTEASLRRAIDHYQSAVRMDPTYAPANAGLADCYNQLGTVMVGSGSPAGFRPMAAAAAIKALQIDSTLSEAHATLGYIRHYEWQWSESEREFKRAIELNPSNALARIWYANLLASLRRFPEALREVERGRELDPFSLVVNTNVGWTLSYAGRLDEAIAQYRKVLAIDPTYVQARLRLGEALVETGKFEEALAEFEETARLTGGGLSSRTAIAGVYALTGRRTHARALLDAILRDARGRYVSPSTVADVYERLGLVDAAFEWLERAYAEHSNHMAYLAVEWHPGLRPDPRYAALMRRVGLE